MSLKGAWIFAIPAEWEALGTPEEPFSYAWSQAVTGYWLPSGLYEVYNVQATTEGIDEIVQALTDVKHVYAWDYAGGSGTGYDSYDVWPTDPAPILAVMKPHVVYVENGDVVSTTPATFENPNWGHVFFGQGERIFAGDYSDNYNGDYL